MRPTSAGVNDTAIEALRWAAFDRLRNGRRASPSDLADDLGSTVDAVNDALAAQAAIGRVELDDNGAVVGAHGLTLVPTRHTMNVGGAELHTWCALDAIGIPASADNDAQVTTSCGWCEQPIAVAMLGGEPADEGSIVLWLPTGPCDNLRQQFCPNANLFCSREHLERWRAQAEHPDGRVLTVSETAELGRQSSQRGGERWGSGIDMARPDAANQREETGSMTCSCCGEERDRLVALQCHDDIKVCPVCIGWLRSRAGIVDVTPILPVRDMPASIAFYETAGFTLREYEPGGGYVFVSYDDESVFDLDLAEQPLDPAANGAGCYLIVRDVDHWHTRLTSAGLPVTDLADQPWGMREFTLTDPSGNHLRIGRSL